MAYNYDNNVIDYEFGSYQDRMISLNSPAEDQEKESKRVKIIYSPDKDSNISFEDKINTYIIENDKKIKIFDIKYLQDSILIIYHQK